MDWNDGMLKTVIKVRICCPVVSYEEITVVFKLKKSQIGTEIDKKPKILQFLKFLYAIFVQFSIDFVDWDVENGHQSRNVLSSSLL